MTPNEMITPQIAPNELRKQMGESILTDTDYTQIFLIMLKDQFHDMSRFKAFIDETSIDLEIYGIIDSAEKVKTWVNAWVANEATKKSNNAITIASIKMAMASNAAAAKRYVEAEKEEHAAINEIMEEFAPSAKQAIVDMLQRNARKAVMMHGPNATQLANMIQAMIEKMA